jgi:adenosylcobyric acid synthase
MAKALMIMGTASDVGKSVIAAGLCRILHRRGVRVAPFKAQNMSLNSFVTTEGGEMGRAQVLQAQASGLPPHVDMNPVLLKPEADNESQVIVHGKVWGRYNAEDYFDQGRQLFGFVRRSYERLARSYDVMVIEGAGSAAEMNLRDKDIVNWPVAQMADARVILVADIDRGGVFAQVIGTLDLLSHEERRRVLGVIINKFRGDPTLFEDGVTFLKARTQLPVLGVVPFRRDLELDQEDSVEIARYRGTRFAADKVNVAVVLLPHMSNFTDFNPLAAESDVALRYVGSPAELAGADVVILPGSKTTIADFDYLQQTGFSSALDNHVCGGGEVVGICGGYQMLGRKISDSHAIEGGGARDGLGFLDVATELTPGKKTSQIKAQALFMAAPAECAVHGYEIHMGITQRGHVAPAFRKLSEPALEAVDQDFDGAMSRDHRVWGTYIHGVFDSPRFRRLWLNRIRETKKLDSLFEKVSEDVTSRLASAIDRWADHLEQHLDIVPVLATLGIDNNHGAAQFRL